MTQITGGIGPSSPFADAAWPLRARSWLRPARRRCSRAKRPASAPSIAPIASSPAARLALAAATGGYMTVFSYLTVRNHHGFGPYGFDLGIFPQGVWLLSEFREPLLILPAFNEEDSLYTGRIFDQFGGLGGFAELAPTRPWELVALALQGDRVPYLWQLLLPLGFLPLFAPTMLVACPPLLANLLTSWPYAHDIRYHYSTLIVPVLVAAAIVAISRFRSSSARHLLVA